jgi:hypothetical protein
MDRLKQLELKKIMGEYSLAKTDEEYTKELIDANKQTFLREINAALGTDRPDEDEEQQPQQAHHKEKKVPDYDISEFHPLTIEKMKKSYRSIVKLTHPDKVRSERLNGIYIDAKTAYENNNVMELFLIGMDLGIEIELDAADVSTMTRITQAKLDTIKSMESSYIWLWITAQTPSEKKEIVDRFIQNNYGLPPKT